MNNSMYQISWQYFWDLIKRPVNDVKTVKIKHIRNFSASILKNATQTFSYTTMTIYLEEKKIQ